MRLFTCLLNNGQVESIKAQDLTQLAGIISENTGGELFIVAVLSEQQI